MQLAYQFPERCERIALVSSGGLGPEVHLLLRAAALPGAEWVLPLIARPGTRDAGRAVGRLLSRLGVRPTPDLTEFARGYGSLADAGARQAFVHTLRAVIDPAGQRVSARDRLYLAAEVPSLVIWGERDRVIPIQHGRMAHEEMPGSRFIVIPDAGHFPQLDQPRRFVEALVEFMADTKPSRLDAAGLRKRLLAGASAQDVKSERALRKAGRRQR
jgi:pimeloyl-ACP methyl ester carboxylesterase